MGARDSLPTLILATFAVVAEVGKFRNPLSQLQFSFFCCLETFLETFLETGNLLLLFQVSACSLVTEDKMCMINFMVELQDH